MREVKRVFRPEKIALGRRLRKTRSPEMRDRRAAFTLTLAATGLLGMLSLFQLGAIRRLPDLRARRFQAEAVSSSGEGYLFETPDAALGVFSYAVTMLLVAAGPADRGRTKPWLPGLAFAKSFFDSANASRLVRIQFRDLHYYCIWCLSISALTFATLPFTADELRLALRRHGESRPV